MSRPAIFITGAAAGIGRATAELYAARGWFVGLYDVFTHPQARGRGLASLLCERLLSVSASEGAKRAYLQVATENEAAMRIYQRLGFVDGYGYHYRHLAEGAGRRAAHFVGGPGDVCADREGHRGRGLRASLAHAQRRAGCGAAGGRGGRAWDRGVSGEGAAALGVKAIQAVGYVAP